MAPLEAINIENSILGSIILDNIVNELNNKGMKIIK